MRSAIRIRPSQFVALAIADTVEVVMPSVALNKIVGIGVHQQNAHVLVLGELGMNDLGHDDQADLFPVRPREMLQLLRKLLGAFAICPLELRLYSSSRGNNLAA